MYLVINKCVTAVKVSNISGHYLRNRSILDTGVLGYIGIVQHKEHSPEVLSIPPGTSCILWLMPVVFLAVVFKLLLWCGAEGYASGLQDAAASCKPDFKNINKYIDKNCASRWSFTKNDSLKYAEIQQYAF